MRSFLILFYSFFCSVVILHSFELKTLTDSKGREIEAYILYSDERFVSIKRTSDNQIFTVPLSDLSKEDFQYFKNKDKGIINPLECLIYVNISKQSYKGFDLEEKESGTAFFMREGGKYYVYTAQHCMDFLDITVFRDFFGNEVSVPPVIEVSNSHDIARFQVHPRKSLKLGTSALLNDTISVYGNSDATSVMTLEKGAIRGIGPYEIEFDAKIVPGNSGGPILNKDNEVIGVVAYAKPGELDSSIKSDTRYKQTRRFSIIPSKIKDWKKIERDEYVSLNQELFILNRKLDDYYYVFDLLTRDGDWVSRSQSFDRDLAEIIRRHNLTVGKPNSKSNTYVDGYRIITNTKSLTAKKKEQNRSQLRALLSIINNNFTDYKITNLREEIHIEYMRNNAYGNSLNTVLMEIDRLKQNIIRRIDLSKEGV